MERLHAAGYSGSTVGRSGPSFRNFKELTGRKATGAKDPVAVMAKLREMKNAM